MPKLPTKHAKKFWTNFHNFAFQGNVIDLAVGIVIGTAFNNLVQSLVNNIIMPVIGNLVGNVNFEHLYINLQRQEYPTLAEAEAAGAPIIKYGAFISQIVDFLILALSLYIVLKVLFRYNPKPKS